MPESTGARPPRNTPWTDEEHAAYLALLAHCRGDEAGLEPCEECRTPRPGECEEGARLRQALQRATAGRAAA
ncbi:hypothetical protein [Streptomyces sp. MJP52]|uniref:hypothetical protein n=1 Tax=Streptomyces sp. MJP52 TaxID=2940555 RepID=UPI002475ACC1|nr:hypothetical protein [Streptomyces sp. MJP52]MDH6224377.1 hypothetical protein [Streptomyces sp. MJP52]